MNPTFTTQKEVVRANAIKALEYYKGNRTHTAKGLGIGIRTLQRMLARYDLKTYLLASNWQRTAKLSGLSAPESGFRASSEEVEAAPSA